MTIEENLKEYILSNYKSLRNFVNTSGIDLPYSTIDGMLKRGIKNASIDNVLKICKALNISADELGNDKIIPNSNSIKHIMISEIPDNFIHMRKNKENYSDLTIDGVILSDEEYKTFIDMNEVTIEFIRKKRREL